MNLKDKVQQGKLGDVRLLLGVVVGVILLCVMFFLIRASNSSEVVAASPAEETSTVVTPEAQTTAPEEELATEAGVGFDETGSYYIYDPGQPEIEPGKPTQRTPEERERLLREMAQSMPEGETLVY